jgi:hypothetical protein
MGAERCICQTASNTIKANILDEHQALAAEQLKYLR